MKKLIIFDLDGTLYQFEWVLKGGEEEVPEVDLDAEVDEELAKEPKVIEEIEEVEENIEDAVVGEEGTVKEKEEDK